MADDLHAKRAAQVLAASRDRLGAHADGDPPATIARLEGAIVAAVRRRQRRRIVLTGLATGLATAVAVASTLHLRSPRPASEPVPASASVAKPDTKANPPSIGVESPRAVPAVEDTPAVTVPARAVRPTAPLHHHLARPAPRPARTVGPEFGEASTLSLENDLFGAALRAEHAGDRAAALRILDQLIRLYPASPLRESAAAERLKLLGSTE